MKIYKLTLKADKKTWVANEQLSELKRQYTEYIEPTALVTEEQLIKAIKGDRFISAEIVGEVKGDQ